MARVQTIYDPLEIRFREGARAGQLLLPTCGHCGKRHWYPRPRCPHCGSSDIRAEAAAGTGTIYSLTRLHDKDKTSRCIAYIELDEGVTLLSSVVDTDASLAHIGRRVQVEFMANEDFGPLPVFRLIENGKT